MYMRMPNFWRKNNEHHYKNQCYFISGCPYNKRYKVCFRNNKK